MHSLDGAEWRNQESEATHSSVCALVIVSSLGQQHTLSEVSYALLRMHSSGREERSGPSLGGRGM